MCQYCRNQKKDTRLISRRILRQSLTQEQLQIYKNSWWFTMSEHWPFGPASRMVPLAGVEPARPSNGAGDFKSPVSTISPQRQTKPASSISAPCANPNLISAASPSSAEELFLPCDVRRLRD